MEKLLQPYARGCGPYEEDTDVPVKGLEWRPCNSQIRQVADPVAHDFHSCGPAIILHKGEETKRKRPRRSQREGGIRGVLAGLPALS